MFVPLKNIGRGRPAKTTKNPITPRLVVVTNTSEPVNKPAYTAARLSRTDEPSNNVRQPSTTDAHPNGIVVTSPTIEYKKFEKIPITPPTAFRTNTISQLVEEVYLNSKEKGFWENPVTFGQLIALCHSEISEIYEEYRKGKNPREVSYENGVPKGIDIEIADAVTMLMVICGHYGIDLEQRIIEKLMYNKTRPKMHGKTI